MLAPSPRAAWVANSDVLQRLPAADQRNGQKLDDTL